MCWGWAQKCKAYLTLSWSLKFVTILSLDKNILLLSETSYFKSYDDFSNIICMPVYQ